MKTYRETHGAAYCEDLEIPQDWQDESWVNDACPRFWVQRAGVVVWIDHPTPAEREIEGFCRFIVCESDDEGNIDPEYDTCLLETDAFDHVLEFVRERVTQ